MTKNPLGLAALQPKSGLNQPMPTLPPGMGYTPTAPTTLPPPRPNPTMPALPPGMGYTPTDPSRLSPNRLQVPAPQPPNRLQVPAPQPPNRLQVPAPQPDPLLPPDRSNPYAHIPGMSADGKTWFNPGMGKNVPISIPEGYELAWDSRSQTPTMKRKTLGRVQEKMNEYGSMVGDGFTGVRDGKNYVNGRLFEPEINNMGETGNEVTWAFQNFLTRSGEELGGSAREYARRIRGLSRGAAAPEGILGNQVPENYWYGAQGFTPMGSEAMSPPVAPTAMLKGGGVATADGSSGLGRGDPAMPATGPMAGNPAMASYISSSAPAGGAVSATKPPGVAATKPNPLGMAAIASGNGGTGASPGDFSVDMSPADMSGLPPINTDFSGQAQRGADAAYAGATQFFDEDFTRDTDALENRLINQGFARGSEAFNEEMGRLQRGQMAARTGAAFTAQGVGHQQAGDLFNRSVTARGALGGEAERAAERRFLQQLGIANLGLNSGFRDRELGLAEGGQDFAQLMALLTGARSGVNVPNFGSPSPLDVGSAYGIASGNANAAANRAAADRGAIYGAAGSVLGNVNWDDLVAYFGG
jgi:hypothetical protein